ncbi:MAG: cell wall-binding protein [Eubacteriales bacterium]|nr:cell wall-binding protein [Eubacteriales bacterium]
MKKNNLIYLSFAFMLFFASFSLCDGWEKNADGWLYSQNGSYCFNTFIQDSGSTYYFDQNGKCVQNSWIKLSDDAWYYAGTTGKLYVDGIFHINDNMYYFDANGKLLKGWIDDTYYANEQGYLVIGWQQLPISKQGIVKQDETEAWYYFKSDGKKVAAENETYTTKTFEDRKYCFDQRGVLCVGWVQMKQEDPEIKGYMYFAEKETTQFKFGQAVVSTWYAAPSPTIANMSEEVAWYYFNSAGYPKCGQTENYQRTRIDNKYYLFNDFGNPVSGVRRVGENYYYFGNDRNDCSMKAGLVSVVDGSGVKNSYYFSSSGQGYSGVYNSKLYFHGLLQKADSLTKYEAFVVNSQMYLVNSSGVIAKNKKKVKDGDGNTWTTNSSGIVTDYEGGRISECIYPEPNVD